MFKNHVFCENEALVGLLTLSHQNKRHADIYKKGEGRRQLYDEPGNREC